MSRIKILSVLSVLIALVSCSKDDYKLESKAIAPFVRFNFLTTSTGTPLVYPAVNALNVPRSSYENKAMKTLKIPVTLSTTALKTPVTVVFSATTSGDANSFSVKPKNELLFEGNKLTDTIFLSFDKRWKEKQDINLKLESVSNPSIRIGNLNTNAPDNTFTVNLGEISTTYNFPQSQFVIKGEAGEKVDFKVTFPNGFIPSEIDNAPIFNFLNGFEYRLTRDDFGDNRNSITYHLTLLKDLKNDDVRYETKITLANIPNYIATGNTVLQIVKPIKSIRDIQANPASKFYDLSNKTYLTYGEHWFNKSGVCVWQAFNAFTFPVVVSKDNENAILYDDKKTANPNDDIYHDAFKIGFNVTQGSGTTNSFGLKRLFPDASISAAISPGFNITSALEFFPENGNNKTRGRVLVIPQYLTIGTTKISHSIEISGEGTYKEISAGLFEISFRLNLKNQALLGGTISMPYKIYNKNTFPKNTAISEPCLKEIKF